MRTAKVMSVVVGGALAVGLTGLGGPVSAKPVDPLPLTLEVTRSGPSPIVAGSGVQTEFTVVVTNPAANPQQPVSLWGNAVPDLTLVDVVSVNGRLDCVNSTTYYSCTALATPPIVSPDTEEGPSALMLAPGESATVKVTFLAEPWVRTSTQTFCSGVRAPLLIPGTEEGFLPPCGIVRDGAPSQVESLWIEKTATVDVQALADLVLTATGASQTDPGKVARLSFTLKDFGPSNTSEYKISFTLPDGLTLVSQVPVEWKCTQTGQKVECLWDPPVSAEAAEPLRSFPALMVDVKTPNPAVKADYGITATATSSATDPTPADASATGPIPMTPVDLAVAKSAGSPVFVDDEATWTVKVSNVGTIDDLGKVTVTDTLPAGAVFTSATGAAWTCTAQGQKLTCTDDDPVFAVGTSEEIVVVSRMTQRGSATNQVSVATTAYEEDMANNAASKSVTVKRAEQNASALPSSPRRILSGKTDEGQKLVTRVRCTPVKASVAGEASYCKVTRGKGVVRVKVVGSTKMRVKVEQTAKGTKALKPFVQRKVYIVKP
jgi:uncharacterized repeat protein (TIGR01451 family)